MQNERLKQLEAEIESLRHQVKTHPIYNEIKSLEDLTIFMEQHVFAVWDFMSVLKVLQQKLTSIHVPWIPRGNAKTRYMINKIVLEEESGIDHEGNRSSHFEIYLKAMEQVGCDMRPVLSLLNKLKSGESFSNSLATSNIRGSARRFIKNTIETSISGDKVHVQAAVFTFGRRDLLPDMFINFIQELDHQNPERVSIFKYYIDLHIKDKDDDLSKVAHEMTRELCGDDEMKWTEATYAINRSLLGRIELWDSILERIKQPVHL
ncbi:heme oxygenase [Sphingobacteriaceae bacterium]|nr:heme oxygenase [Sphingobacteriaceae bacterium]